MSNITFHSILICAQKKNVFSLQRPGFNARAKKERKKVLVEFVVDNVAMGQVSFQVLLYITIPPSSILICYHP